jgi:DNA ligase-1
MIESFGPVRTVTPSLVFELAFEGIQRSSRHKSGVAERFLRILRWRTDKKPEEADQLGTLQAMILCESLSQCRSEHKKQEREYLFDFEAMEEER